MSLQPVSRLLFLISICFLAACAQIVPPQGGKKDVAPPRLLSITPPDSQLNTRVTRIEMRFDEFINLSNASSEVTISPILPFPPDVSVLKKTVIVKIPDSLLLANTTYRISFGKAIQDVHENNPFAGYTYTFSTGSFFDSLALHGYVMDAATGQRDSAALVVLYDASKSDSVIVREKPIYATRTDGAGNFTLAGLPDKDFRIYAMHDANNNMVYDGSGEMVAFLDTIVRPGVATHDQIRLDIFAEADSTGNIETTEGKTNRSRSLARSAEVAEGFTYNVLVDTSDTKRRTQELTRPLEIQFSKPVVQFNANRVFLAYDSAGVAVEADVSRLIDTFKKNSLLLNTTWKENVVYTLKLLKGFAQDSAGTDAMPGRYSFRTKRDEDYAKLHVHLPGKYLGPQYVFVLLNGADTVYQRTVRDTMVNFNRLAPGTYTLRVIADRNQDGQWTTGDLLGKRQPEEVIPYTNPVGLKAGWENLIDFETPVRGTGKQGLSPGKRDATGR